MLRAASCVLLRNPTQGTMMVCLGHDAWLAIVQECKIPWPDRSLGANGDWRTAIGARRLAHGDVRMPDGAHECLYGGMFPGMLGYKLHRQATSVSYIATGLPTIAR